MSQPTEKPMMAQYKRIKDDYLDAILMFRVGGFFQMYFHDAVAVNEALGLKLISRNAGANVMIPMCGVPRAAVENRARQLCDMGYRVVICDQVDDRTDDGITVRRVTHVFEPDGEQLDLSGAWVQFLDENTFEPRENPQKRLKKSSALLDALRKVDLETTTPAGAFRILYDWKQKYCPEESLDR